MNSLVTYWFADHGRFSNSHMPMLVYRDALPADLVVMERDLAANGWSNAWRDGIFTYHHFHSTADEVLGSTAGEVRVAFGGLAGQVVTVRAGDVVAIPAGVAHRNVGETSDLLVVGVYPDGCSYDTKAG